MQAAAAASLVSPAPVVWLDAPLILMITPSMCESARPDLVNNAAQ